MRIDDMVYAAGLRQAWHTHSHASISFVVHGEVFETHERGTGRASVGDVIVKPPRIPHDDVYGRDGARMYTLVLEEDLGGYRLLFGGSPPALFLRMIGEWRARAPFRDVAVDLLASIAGDAPGSRSTPAMQEVAERIVTTPVSVEELARERSMHPVALARAFRREYGCSITAYRRRARVRRAAEMLATGVPLVDVALDSGFADQSHFCRIFRTEMGVTPSRFRALTV